MGLQEPRKSKLMLINLYFIPIISYCLGKFTIQENYVSKLNAAEMKCSGSVILRTRRYEIRNETIREK